MKQEQIDTLGTVMEVLRPLTMALGALNPSAMQKAANVLWAAAAEKQISPAAASMLRQLAHCIELLCQRQSGQEPDGRPSTR